MEKDKIELEVIKKLPIKSLVRIIDKVKEQLKKDETVIKAFKEYDVEISEIDLVPMYFGDLDVSASTNHAVICLNYKLLCPADLNSICGYGAHELIHYLQQTTGSKGTQGADDGEYLKNPYEQEAFQHQVEFIANHEGEEEAEEYVEKLLDHHEVKGKKKKDELEAVLLEKI